MLRWVQSVLVASGVGVVTGSVLNATTSAGDTHGSLVMWAIGAAMVLTGVSCGLIADVIHDATVTEDE